MIVKFNPALFHKDGEESLTAIFDLFYSYFNDAFLWDMDNLEELFLSEEGEFIFQNNFTKNYLAPKHFDKLESKVYEAFERAAYNTKTHQKYLRSLTIGEGEGEISPPNALPLFKNPSYLIVENGPNDGKFLEGLIMNYANFGKRGSVYELIHQAFTTKRLKPSHAGGGGGLKATVEQLRFADLGDHAALKLFILFDSDRNSSNAILEKYVNLLSFLKGRDFDRANPQEWTYKEIDNYLWHMTYKREQENYVPLEAMYQQFKEIDAYLQQTLNNGSNEYRDFFDFSTVLDDGYKNVTPTLFLKTGLVQAIESKCSHHRVPIELPNGTLEQVSEIEDILIKIAKII